MSLVEDELQLPSSATLLPVTSVFFLEKISTTPMTSHDSGNDRNTNSHVTQQLSHVDLSQGQSQRPAARCLLVGRQAATADLRIQHGSISRKHAVLYYETKNTNEKTDMSDESSSSSSMLSLCMKDLGGKHGTQVNGVRTEGNVPIVLRPGDVILFGTDQDSGAFRVIQKPSSIETTIAKTKQQQSEENSKLEQNDVNIVTEKENETSSNDLQTKDIQKNDVSSTAVPVTRRDREDEIAAMVASLDAAPTYETFSPVKAIPDDEEQRTDNHGRTTKKLSVAKQFALPIAQEFHIEATDEPESKTKHGLTCLVVDKSGSRFAVGHGSYLKLYDFSGMDRKRTAPFKLILVEDGYSIERVCYSNSGDRILVGTASPQPTIFDRDGEELVQFVRGDQYVMDMARTTGHVNAVTGVDWHPLERDIVVSSSMDGSARLWNLNGKTVFHKLVCDKVYRAKNARGQRTSVTAVVYHPGGLEFAIGTSCGSLQIWSTTKVGPRPEKVVYDVHGSGKPVRAVVYNAGGTQIATRSSEDDVVHVWDARRLSKSAKPLASCSNVPTVHESSSCDFSPNGKYVVVGCSDYEKNDVGKRQEVGTVKIFKAADGSYLDEVPAKPGVGVVQVKWHRKLNQILVGCSDGSVMVLYDESMSKNGAMISAAKAGRAVDSLSELLTARAANRVVTGEIVAPFASHSHSKRKNRDDDDNDNIKVDGVNPAKLRRPEPPARGIKAGGQSSASATFTQFVSKSITKKKVIAGKDPRESLFQYHDAESAAKGEKRILSEKTAEEEEDERRLKKT